MAEKKQVQLTTNQVFNLLRNAQARLEIVDRQIGAAQRMISEIIAAKDSLAEIKKLEKNGKIMLPLGAGMYTEAAIADNADVNMSLAGNILVKASIKKAIEELERELEAANKNMQTFQSERLQLAQNIEGMARILNEFERRQAAGEEKKQEKEGGSGPSIIS